MSILHIIAFSKYLPLDLSFKHMICVSSINVNRIDFQQAMFMAAKSGATPDLPGQKPYDLFTDWGVRPALLPAPISFYLLVVGPKEEKQLPI